MIKDFGPLLLIPIMLLWIFIAPLLQNVIKRKAVSREDVKGLFKFQKTPISWGSMLLVICGLVLNLYHMMFFGTLLGFLAILYVPFSYRMRKKVGK